MVLHGLTGLRALMASVTLGVLINGAAFADCQADSNKAMLLLLNFKQQALSNQHQSQDAFKAEFAPLVNRLQQGHCQQELMGMMGFIQSEQKTYPAPQK